MYRIFNYTVILTCLFVWSVKPSYSYQENDSAKSGLLFYLSGSKEFKADFSKGSDEPNFLNKVKLIKDGAVGAGFECEHSQLLSYKAAGNIYSERGTLLFYWRSREPVGKTEFPVFRVSYGDHSSWDMVWLRIDYNGGGFDAFVTDINLARIRISYKIPEFPDPKTWTHIALSWDETKGIKFYINGRMVCQKDTNDVFYAALDQFGPHSRTISPMQVQSSYNFIRGGDIDEIRIYDHALSDREIEVLSKGSSIEVAPAANRDLNEDTWKNEWTLRYGWNREGDYPPYLDNKETAVRKVEIEEAYDLKRMWWKANDGIRETTWPGVYNRSRILGRNDYFQLPDWDCYSLSGKSIRFIMPNELWNYLEISGGAFGKISLSGSKDNLNDSLLFVRPKGQERTFHKLKDPVNGKVVVFTNEMQENPIGEFNAFFVRNGKAPAGCARLEYEINTSLEPAGFGLEEIIKYIEGRYTLDEKDIVMALPKGVNGEIKKDNSKRLPIVHILIPDYINGLKGPGGGAAYTWDNIDAGLDGVEIEIPALNVKPVKSNYFPINIQIKDPIWPLRNMIDFSFSVKPEEPRVLWLDLRDRILRNGKPLYLTISASGCGFYSSMLNGAKIRLIFKERSNALKEHIADRFNQVKDNYAMIIEEHMRNNRLDKFKQFEADMTDLLRVDPDNSLAKIYWWLYHSEQPRPKIKIPMPPKGVPIWAFYQIEDLKAYKRFVEWYIDNRQIENGEFGGGLSDDSDLGNWWPGLALMGSIPDKVKNSNVKMMEAIYNNGMFTNGLPTIQTDGLHTYEEGINVLGQVNLLDFGNPKNVERMMQSVRALKEKIIGINKAGHTHFRTSYFSADKIADEGVWGWSYSAEYLLLQPALYLGEYFGNESAKKMVIDITDGLLAHARKDSSGKVFIDTDINFKSDESRTSPLIVPAGYNSFNNVPNNVSVIHSFWAAYCWTGNEKYLKPILDLGNNVLGIIQCNLLDILNLRDSWGRQILEKTKTDTKNDLYRHIAWQISGRKKFLEECYKDQTEEAAVREYANTLGSVWIDRVYVAEKELQRARLGGVAISRNQIFPGNAVSWKFQKPASAESVAILINHATSREISIEVYNIEKYSVGADLSAWNILPGKWEVFQGIDKDGDGNADEPLSTRIYPFSRSNSLHLKFPPQESTILKLKLVEKEEEYSQRADLAISDNDIKISEDKMSVTVHNLGSVDSKPSKIVLTDGNGKLISTTEIPVIKAPSELIPETIEVSLHLPKGLNFSNLSLQIDPEKKSSEITRENNIVKLNMN